VLSLRNRSLLSVVVQSGIRSPGRSAAGAKSKGNWYFDLARCASYACPELVEALNVNGMAFKPDHHTRSTCSWRCLA